MHDQSRRKSNASLSLCGSRRDHTHHDDPDGMHLPSQEAARHQGHRLVRELKEDSLIRGIFYRFSGGGNRRGAHRAGGTFGTF
jgi:hypothetical protein